MAQKTASGLETCDPGHRPASVRGVRVVAPHSSSCHTHPIDPFVHNSLSHACSRSDTHSLSSVMVNIRVDDNEPPGGQAVSQTMHQRPPDCQTHSDEQDNDMQSTTSLFRHVLLNKSISFDSSHRHRPVTKRMSSSTSDAKFHPFIREDVFGSSSSSDDCDQRDSNFASALSTTTDDCVSLTSTTKSRMSHREKVLIRRKKLMNLRFLNSPLDLISSSSSEEEDEDEAEDESNHNVEPGTLAKRTSSKITDEMLLSVLCDFSSDDSSSCSLSADLCHCRPPSLMDRLTISSASSAGSPQHVRHRVRRFRSGTGQHCIRRKAMRNLIKSCSPQELSLRLDMTKPPSLMDQISGKSDVGFGSRNSASSGSLNSLSSEIFDLPGSDSQVNEAANILTEGINELTKNADRESDQKTFPIVTQRAESTDSQDNLSLAAHAGSCSTGGSNTTTYSIEPSPVVSPFQCDSNDDPVDTPDEESEDQLLGDVSPVPLMDYMRIVMSESVEVDAQSDFGVDDLPTDNTLTLIAGDGTLEDNKTLVEDSSGGSYQTCAPASAEEVSSSVSCYTDAVDDAFNDTSGSEFQSAEDYERFLIHENAKLIAHTLAEMAYCTNSSATTDDFKSLVSASSFDVLDINDVSLAVSDEDEDSRATYNVSSDAKRKKKAARDLELTYRLDSPRIPTSRSTPFMSTPQTRCTESSDTTYSLDPPQKEKSVVKIRETRSSALRNERARKARSMEVTSLNPKSSAAAMNRKTFVKVVRKPAVNTSSASTSTSASKLPAKPAVKPVTSCSMQSLQSSPLVRQETVVTGVTGRRRSGVQAKFSAFLQRIRS